MSQVKAGASGSSADLARVHAERARMRAIAYRLLGTVADAEDAAQETYLRWYRLSAEERAQVHTPMAWYTTTLTRICFDKLRSAQARREVYVGEWLPEPVSSEHLWTDSLRSKANPGPFDRLTLDDSISMALMIVLEKMTPAERVSFILHDVFQFSFSEISGIVGRTPQACRQLASTARQRIGQSAQSRVDPNEHRRVNAAFKAAWTSGDVAGLISVLDCTVRAVTDGGGRVSAAVEPLSGAKAVSEFFLSVFQRQPDLQIEETLVNGEPGLAGRAGGQTVAVLSTRVGNGKIKEIWVMRNPDKLTNWQEQ